MQNADHLILPHSTLETTVCNCTSAEVAAITAWVSLLQQQLRFTDLRTILYDYVLAVAHPSMTLREPHEVPGQPTTPQKWRRLEWQLRTVLLPGGPNQEAAI